MSRDAYEDTIEVFAAVSAIVFTVAALALWLGDHPGGRLRWRLATTSAFAAAGLGLLASQVISHLWDRPRPYIANPDGVILVTAANPDPSFPSDHATAAFAIAFAILFLAAARESCSSSVQLRSPCHGVCGRPLSERHSRRRGCRTRRRSYRRPPASATDRLVHVTSLSSDGSARPATLGTCHQDARETGRVALANGHAVFVFANSTNASPARVAARPAARTR